MSAKNDAHAQHELFRSHIARFVDAEIGPCYAQWERDELFPRELWNTLGEQGLLAVDVPESYGGPGADFRSAALIIEVLNQANYASLGLALAVHSNIVAHYILNNGTELQKQRYLPAMVSGECIGAIAMTEPDAGSDLQGIRTSARLDGSDYVINGSKTLVSNGQHSDLLVVAARSNFDVPATVGTTLFLVDATAEGFRRGRKLEKVGLLASDTAELFFDDLRVPRTAILGQADRGFAVLMDELQRERLVLAIASIAAADGVLSETIAYVNQRHAFGAAIAKLQNTRFKLAEAATDIRIHRSFVSECESLFMQGRLDVSEASMAKYSAAEMQGRVVDACLQLYGGYGYMREQGVSRAFVDARAQRIHGGTSEIMLEIISQCVLDADI